MVNRGELKHELIYYQLPDDPTKLLETLEGEVTTINLDKELPFRDIVIAKMTTNNKRLKESKIWF